MLFAVQFAIVLLCILVGAQVGGIGLGVFGGLGEQFQRALAVAVVGIALLGEFQAAVVAIEQLRTDGFF